MRQTSHRVLDFIGTHATRFLAGGVLVGFLVPPLAHLAAPLLIPALLIPLVIALVRLDWSAFGHYARRPGIVIVLTVWLLAACPLAMWLLLKGVPMPQPLFQALVLMSASSPIISAAALCLLLGLDGALAVVMIIVTTALVPLTLPVVAFQLLGMAVNLDPAAFMLRLTLMVAGAFGAALVVRRLVPGTVVARNARVLDGISVLTLVVFAIAIMDGVTALALRDPGYVALATAAAFAANLALQGAGTLIALKLGVRRALTVGLMTGNCNMGLVLVALGKEASFEIVAFFAMGQLPMYMLPGVLMPVYRRLTAAA